MVGAFENRVLRKIFGPKRQNVQYNCVIRRFIICIPHPVLFR
jgi:hypothetical protein